MKLTSDPRKGLMAITLAVLVAMGNKSWWSGTRE